jgi:hypothetical protein
MCSPHCPLPAMFPSDPHQTLSPVPALGICLRCWPLYSIIARVCMHSSRTSTVGRAVLAGAMLPLLPRLHKHCKPTPPRPRYAKGQPLKDPDQTQRNARPEVATSGCSKPPWPPHQATSKHPLGAGQARSLCLHAVGHEPTAIHPLHLSCGPCA